MKKNGILAYPKKMASALCRFVVAAYAREIQRKFKANPLPEVVLKDIGAVPGIKADAKGVYRAHIKVDLSDLPANYPKEKMQAFYVSLPVAVIATTGVGQAAGTFSYEPAGEYKARNPQIQVVVTPYDLASDPLTYAKTKERLCSTLRHELQHFVQIMLAMALEVPIKRTKKKSRKDVAGYPIEYFSPEMQEAKAKLDRIQKDIVNVVRGMSQAERTEFLGKLGYAKYATEPIEFFPWVSDFRARLSQSAQRQPGQKRITKEMILALENDPHKGGFFSVLKKAAPTLHRRLLAELYSFANNFNAAEAEKERAAKRPINASRVIAAVLEDLDRERSSRAGYLRLNRQHFLDYAQAELAAQGR
jgi:hypothetical protein